MLYLHNCGSSVSWSLVAKFILAWKWKRKLNMVLTKVLARKFDSRNWPLIGLGEDFVHCGNTAIWIS
jgi:hypothetical protein